VTLEGKGKILVASKDGVYLMKFIGDVRVTLAATADTFLEAMFCDKQFKSVVVDLSKTSGIDSTSLGILAKLSILARERFGYTPTLVSTNNDITRLLKGVGFDDVFHIVREPIAYKEQLGELPKRVTSEEDVRERVLEAHRALVSLNEANREEFQDLVKTLEAASR
jgi:anti-anti-sigma factor